jgi:hypothetical protein
MLAFSFVLLEMLSSLLLNVGLSLFSLPSKLLEPHVVHVGFFPLILPSQQVEPHVVH